jgi:hypothetical protein
VIFLLATSIIHDNENIAFQIKILGALSVGDGLKWPIPSLLPSQNHYLESYRYDIFVNDHGRGFSAP